MEGGEHVRKDFLRQIQIRRSTGPQRDPAERITVQKEIGISS